MSADVASVLWSCVCVWGGGLPLAEIRRFLSKLLKGPFAFSRVSSTQKCSLRYSEQATT